MLISWRMGFGVFGFFGTVSKNVLLSWSWLLVSRIQKHVKFHVQLHMHVHVHILAYACTCTHTHRQQYEQYHTDSLDRRTKQKGQKPKEAVKSLTTHSRIAPAARLEGVDSGGGYHIYICIHTCNTPTLVCYVSGSISESPFQVIGFRFASCLDVHFSRFGYRV